MLAPDKAIRLHYRGEGCGGVNLPFETELEALRYAAGRYALEARLEARDGGERRFARPDCRYRWVELERGNGAPEVA